MASNCPHWKSGTCEPPSATSIHACSYSQSNYEQCAVYEYDNAKATGATTGDALESAGVLSPFGRTVVVGPSAAPSSRTESSSKKAGDRDDDHVCVAEYCSACETDHCLQCGCDSCADDQEEHAKGARSQKKAGRTKRKSSSETRAATCKAICPQKGKVSRAEWRCPSCGVLHCHACALAAGLAKVGLEAASSGGSVPPSCVYCRTALVELAKPRTKRRSKSASRAKPKAKKTATKKKAQGKTGAEKDVSGERPEAVGQNVCPNCGKQVSGTWVCPHCGRIEWGSFATGFVMSIGLLGAAVFWAPAIESSLWKFVVRWIGGGLGVITLLVNLKESAKIFSAKKQGGDDEI